MDAAWHRARRGRRSGQGPIYKHWTGGYAVAVDAYGDSVTDAVPVLSTGDAVADLASQVRRLAVSYGGSRGRVAAQLLAAGTWQEGRPQLLRDTFFGGRRSDTVALIEPGKADGQLRADLDSELVVDLLFGPIVFRLFNGLPALDGAGADAPALAQRAIAADSSQDAGRAVPKVKTAPRPTKLPMCRA